MRVLMINHFPLVGSGSGTYTRNIAVHLTKKGHDVGIIMPENTNHIQSLPGIELRPVFFTFDETIGDSLPFNFPCFTTHPRSTTTFYDLDDNQLEMYISAFEKAIRKSIAQFKPDVIHSQHIWILSWLAGKTGIPNVITAHGTDLMGYQRSARFRHYADEATAEAKKIVTISDDNDKLVRELFPGSSDRVVYMKNGYDPERFYPDPIVRDKIQEIFNIRLQKKLVLFAGKLAHFKGVDVLLEAARLYEGERPDEIVTVIAGDGELASKLKKLAQDYKLRHTLFLGHLDIPQLRGLYSAADVSVVPSRREPFGLVAVEALACGCPVVATNQGGLPDIINDKVGALVDVDDAFGLSSAIMRELYRPDREQRGRYAAKYALENYAQDSLIDSLIEIFRCV